MASIVGASCLITRAVRARPAIQAARIVLVTLGIASSAGSTGSTRGAWAPENEDAGASTRAPQADREHRWIARARRYREAVRRSDVDSVLAMQAPDARLWFDEKTGAGRALDAGGKGPWQHWDHFFRSSSSQTNFVVEGDAVRFTNREINDWFRLIERAPIPYYIYYFFDENDRISGKLIQGIEELQRPADRLDEFRAWADDRYPGLMENLMPNGDIDPTLEKARLWKTRLLEWRADAMLPKVLEDPK